MELKMLFTVDTLLSLEPLVRFGEKRNEELLLGYKYNQHQNEILKHQLHWQSGRTKSFCPLTMDATSTDNALNEDEVLRVWKG